MLILAGVSLNAIIGDNGIITNAQRAAVMSRFSTYKEELGMNALEDTGIYASGDKLKQYIPSMEDQDIDKFVIMKSELLYIATDELEANVAQNLRLGGISGETSDSGAAIKEIQNIIGGVVELKENFTDKVPADDSQLLDEPEHTNNADGLIGTRLFDRNSLNMQNHTWNILDEYNSNNEKTARYGTGYYWLKKGVTYTIDGESIEFKNDYVVDYTKNEYIVLSGRAVNWNENSTLAVTDGLVLNVDPASLANGEWINDTTGKTYEVELQEASEIEDENNRIAEINKIKNENFYNFYVTNPSTNVTTDTGVQKTGDVVYNDIQRSLRFNEDISNTNGEGGYLKYSVDPEQHINFSQGFCFEIYMNLSRLRYTNLTMPEKGNNLGLFVKIPSLGSPYANALRFGAATSPEITICRFCPGRECIYGGSKLENSNNNLRIKTGNIGYETNEDVYLTFNFKIYDANANDEFKTNEYDSYMIENNLDKIEYYINGNLFGYTYSDKSSYAAGLACWDNDESPFYLGVCPWQSTGNLYYLKGQVFSTRIYNKSMTSGEVKANYETTLKYRSSFSD